MKAIEHHTRCISLLPFMKTLTASIHGFKLQTISRNAYILIYELIFAFECLSQASLPVPTTDGVK
jgi:hypothetical protein